ATESGFLGREKSSRPLRDQIGSLPSPEEMAQRLPEPAASVTKMRKPSPTSATCAIQAPSGEEQPDLREGEAPASGAGACDPSTAAITTSTSRSESCMQAMERPSAE